jgi:trafficking protein particle complex subunit 6
MSKLPPTETDDPNNPKVAASTLDFLLIELVPLAQRVTEQLEARHQALVEEYKRSKILSRSESDTDNPDSTEPKDGPTSEQEIRPMTSLGFPEVKTSTQDAILVRLDSLGYRVGQGLVER